MRRPPRYLAVLLASALCACGESPGGHSDERTSPERTSTERMTPERLARDVVRAFQRGDVEDYLALCGTRADLVAPIRRASRTDAEKQEARSQLDRQVQRYDEERRANFDKLLHVLDWFEVRVVRLDTTALEERDGLRGYKHVWVHLEAGRPLVLEIDGIALLDRGWAILDDDALALSARVPDHRVDPKLAPRAAPTTSEIVPDPGGTLQEAEGPVARLPSRPAAPDSPDALVRAVVRSLQRKDVEAFLHLCGWREDAREILAAADLTAEARAAAEQELREMMSRLPLIRRACFTRVSQAIDWSRATSGAVDFKRHGAGSSDGGASGGVEIGGPVPGRLWIQIMARATRGWVLMDEPPITWIPEAAAARKR